MNRYIVRCCTVVVLKCAVLKGHVDTLVCYDPAVIIIPVGGGGEKNSIFNSMVNRYLRYYVDSTHRDCIVTCIHINNV